MGAYSYTISKTNTRKIEINGKKETVHLAHYYGKTRWDIDGLMESVLEKLAISWEGVLNSGDSIFVAFPCNDRKWDDSEFNIVLMTINGKFAGSYCDSSDKFQTQDIGKYKKEGRKIKLVTVAKRILNKIIEESAEYEDGELGIDGCIDMYCEYNNIDEEIADQAKDLANEQGALAAGIPLSVIRREKKLSDFYSKEYLDHKCGRR